MGKKRLILLAFCMTGFALAASPVNAATRNLYCPLSTQEKSNWCWNAVSQMIARSNSRSFSEQCELAEYARKRNPALFGNTNCCLNPDAGRNNTNSLTGAGSMQDIMDQQGVGSNLLSGAVAYGTAKTYIDGNRRLIGRWGWFGGGGHVFVIHGYADQNVSSLDRLYIADPWPGEGKTLKEYDDV